MRVLFLVLLFLTAFPINAQKKYPQDAFRPPLDIPIILAGTFGELRSNHFHSGIDIKTQQRQGLPVFAIGGGTVTRIKVSLYGYGKALYVAHPNGYTSVYAHLQKFSPEIEDYVRKIQYRKRAYEIETFPEYGTLKVNKDSIIAYTGNTGGSAGPHLHFEIRNSVTEKPTNPLLYGLNVRDATNPTLLGLFGYPLSNKAQLNSSNTKIQLNYTKQPDGSFLADKVQAIGTIGFGFNAFDRQDLAANKNGVYSVKQIVNGTVYTDYDFESFSFTETRYINTLIDYAHFGKFKQRIQRCFKVAGNNLAIYNKLYNDGKINVQEGLSYTVELLITDFDGNETKVIIPVEGKRGVLKNIKKKMETSDYIIARKPNNFNLGAASVYFPANSFYENFYIDLEKGKDTIRIHNNEVPLHRNFTISFDASKYTAEERKQLFIAHLNKRGKASYAPTYKRANTFTTRTRIMGTYTLVKDTVAPKIRAKNFKPKQWLNNYKYLSVRISDDLSGVDTYNATINGKWILMEYESKTNTLTYNFNDITLDQKQCELKVIVTDNVGNSSTFTSTFFRK